MTARGGVHTGAERVLGIPVSAALSDTSASPASFSYRATFASYAHPERLVSTDWLARSLNDGLSDSSNLVVLESDEDVLLYDTGHIPGAVKVDWHLDLNDPVARGEFSGELLHMPDYPQVRNYDGSWTEWGNAVRVPIEVGAT